MGLGASETCSVIKWAARIAACGPVPVSVLKHTCFKNIYFAIHSGFIPRRGLCCCAWWSSLPPWRADSGETARLGFPYTAADRSCCPISCVCSGASCSPMGGETTPLGQAVSSGCLKILECSLKISKNAVCSRCFPMWERSPESTFQCTCDPCHQHRWRLIPLCELRALGLGKEAPLKHSLVSLEKTWNISRLPYLMLWLPKRQDMTSSLE